MTVRFGVDRVVDTPALLHGAGAVGLVTNDAARLARDARLHARVALRDAGVPLVRLFGPEHGLDANAADGAAVPDGTDARTGLPVVSLYGERLAPTRAQLAGLDRLLFDVPDVGARFYTYAWTLFHVLGACAEAGLPLTVLDRPNPLGGDIAHAEGPMLDAALASFVGADRIPIRHALTLGELARVWQRERWPHATLDVITCEGWTRDMPWPDTGLPWVPTSPAMPSMASVLTYPGLCLFEGTELSVGRGTEAPFQHVGAPWLDADAVIAWLARAPLPGVTLEHDVFVPDAAPHAGERCQAVRVVVTDVRAHRPVALGLWLLAAVIATHRGAFAWARYPTAANSTGDGHLDRLVGERGVREWLDASAERTDAARVGAWTAAPGWAARVAPALLYG
jgi:uncharacterized protein YbbC (DUF1343 family)